MKIIVRSILMDRERRRLEKVAHDRGFDSAAVMLHDMYATQGIPLEKIAKTLYTPIWSLRKRFDELGISVRTRGGRNHVRFEVTKELYEEVCRDGAMAVSERLGVDSITLSMRIQKWYTENILGGKSEN